MYSEGAPEFIADQGFYYPTPMNYGYYYTGFEGTGEWDSQHQFLDGQEVQYMGGQLENFPYQYYYAPDFEYTQPFYNQYDPYGSGTVAGSNVSQVYATHPQHNDYVPSAPYYHSGLQPMTDVFLNSAPGNTTNRSIPSRVGSNQTLSSASAPFTMVSTNHTLKQTNSVSEKCKESRAVLRQTLINERGSDGAVQVANNMSNGTAQPYEKQLKPTLPAGGALDIYRKSVYQPVGVNKMISTHYGGGTANLSFHSNMSSDQNPSHPVNNLDHQLVVKCYTTKAGHSNAEGNIIILLDQYNKEDFPVEYGNAKFFVIKSYSEDDVHKSIKYNVWSSTPNGNKKLDKAYEDAQRIAQKDHQDCPLFLFFSVNASGNFCGVAEMRGRVDFNKDMDFWQQDKWSGSFPVKWHIIKDVPNVKFRHITLENNENNPVTYSRDTQEVMYTPGLEVLKIFKAHTPRASLLDDFMYYESREKFMHEERARQPSKRYSAPVFIPALDPPPPRKLKYVVRAPATCDKQLVDQKYPSSSEEISAGPLTDKVTPTNEATDTSITKSESNGDSVVASLKIGSLTISTDKPRSSPAPAPAPAPSPADSEQEDTITVGTMPVKINGLLKKSTSSVTSVAKPQEVRQQKLD